MKVAARPYRDPADLTLMRRLLVEGAQAGLAASYMHPGCLDWAIHLPPDEAAHQRNLYLFERVDGGQPALAAWAIFLAHEGSVDLFVHPSIHGTPAHAAVMAEYLAWAEARVRAARLASLWPFWAMEYDHVLRDLLVAHGFQVTPVDPAPPLFERVLDDLPPLRLPAGFTVAGVHSPEAGRQRAAVTHSAFQPETDWDAYWDRYARFMASSVYAGERDLLVRAPDGQGASACTLWFDPVNRVGLFEPVATHRAFQGRGLGKAVMVEGLRRMRAAGMQRAILGFDPNNAAARALYTSLGFGASAHFLVAHKPLPPRAD